MLKLLLAVLLGTLAGTANAVYVGKLDLAKDPQAFIGRELQEGMWLGGIQKPLYHVERRDCNENVCAFQEIVHVGFLALSRLEGQQSAYGPSFGAPIGAALAVIANKVAFISAASDAAPPFLKKLGDFASVDAFVLYRPQLSADAQNHLLYGVGGTLRIPISSVLSYAKGDGQKGL